MSNPSYGDTNFYLNGDAANTTDGGADGIVDVLVDSEELKKGTATLTAAGDAVVYTPAPGKAIRLYFFGYSAGADVSGNLLSIRLEGYNGGVTVDQQYLSSPGQPYARNIQAGLRYIQGAPDGRLIVNASEAQTVYVNFELNEV